MRVLTLTVMTFLAGVSSVHAFEDVLRTHGGFWNWRAYHTMRYDVVGWPFSPDPRSREAETVDLETRRIRIDGGGARSPYHLGFDGRSTWVRPSFGAVHAPSRFYALVPFQLIGMPFVLGEAGVRQEDLGYRVFDGRLYEVFAFHLPAGADTPADTFVAYVDDDTRLLHMVTFDFTYPALADRGGGPSPACAVVFDEWQNVSGLTVPRTLSFHDWVNGRLGATRASFSVENVAFDQAAVVPSAFADPGEENSLPLN